MQREALRQAAWQGAGRMLGVILAALVAGLILYPLINRGHRSGPDPVPPMRVALAIQACRKENDDWPQSFTQVWRTLRSVPISQSPRVAFLPLKVGAKEADYAISVDGTLEGWRIPVAASPKRVGAEAISGFIHPGA